MHRITQTFRLLVLAAFCLGIVSSAVLAQTQTPPTSKQKQPDDVLRINTELVQTDVMVFDKKGRFVDGLRREQFELSIDGKPQPITFFEQVRAGSFKEQALAASGKAAPAPEKPAVNESRGRTIVFFIDDLHLSLDSLGRTRKTLARFIDNEMNEHDRVAIASTSGDIGFLQQFTDNKSVLRAAAGRLIQHPYNTRDMTRESTPMTEYVALTIERKDDPGVFLFYVEQCLASAPLRYPRRACEVEVINRARLILLQAAAVVSNTYESLESLMRSSAQLPGRKLVFFISDGFLLDTGPRNSDPRGKLSRITDAALRAGVVIYTIDARGLFSGQLDATNNVPMDAQGRLESVSLREIPASQDALNALAGDTGGRALRNQSFFDRWVEKILEETSEYYLLAWRPNNESETRGDFRNLTARVIDHPEYTVRLPRGFLKANPSPPPKSSAEVQTAAQTHRELQQALTSLNPRREIPTSLSLVFLDTPEHGPVLTASVQVANEALSYQERDAKQVANIDLVGVVINDKGKQAGSFQTGLKINSVTSVATAQDRSATIYNYRLPLKPGLYQVRVAARDTKSEQVGSAQKWIEIPDLGLRRLSMSSLLLGLQSVGSSNGVAGTPQLQFSVDHRFARNSRLRFVTFVYNAARSPDGKSLPEVMIQARILHRGQIVKTMPVQKVTIGQQDIARIPYQGEIALDAVPAGQSILEITVTDQIAKMTVTQQTKITVE
jgi:VWFA-related protein